MAFRRHLQPLWIRLAIIVIDNNQLRTRHPNGTGLVTGTSAVARLRTGPSSRNPVPTTRTALNRMRTSGA